jgi:hypothetical protein
MNPYYAWFIVFGIIIYLIVVDQNIATYIVLLWRQTKLNYERLKWVILNDPRNPIVKFMIERKYLKLAKEMEKRMNER